MCAAIKAWLAAASGPAALRQVSLLIKLNQVVLPVLCGSLLALAACGPVADAPDESAHSAALYGQLLRTLYHHTVPTVAPAALVRELAQPTAPELLDARTPAEYRVSHLRGARFVGFDSVAAEAFAGLPRCQSVVVYCAVGVRSERLGERLHALGFRHVRNLYGGLFEWVNGGYPVYDAAGPTTKVHPYSALWSPWLKRGKKAYE